jgi:predicted dehydrogenase
MLRVGILSVAHLHACSYVHSHGAHPRAELIGLWDNAERGQAFSERTGVPYFSDIDALLGVCDAVCVCSENNNHLELVQRAAARGKHILCEKPLVTREEDAKAMTAAVEAAGVVLMTAFPCRYSPAYARLKERVDKGEIGRVRAICATNRGSCPGGWFVQKDLSGGGAMIDHVVHVTDLIRDLLGEEPVKVQAQTGNNTYGKDWEDTAMVTMEFGSGIFATLDSSWSRPSHFKTWGDVTMTVVGEKGTIELDMFGPAVGVYGENGYRSSAYGSDLDAAMVDAFVRACLDGVPAPTSMHDGLQAARVALAGYRSVEVGQPVSLTV